MRDIAVLLAAYAVGSVPFGWLVPRCLGGFEIRSRGSGNPGATNVWRTMGPAAGLAVGLLDGAKGWLAVAAARPGHPDTPEWLGLATALAAVAGHVWPVWLGFRGGKGVITSAGAFLALAPLPVLGAGVVFGAGLALSGRVSVGSLAAALALPALTAGLDGPWRTRPLILAATAAGLLVWIRHRSNLARILSGSEPRLTGRRR